MDKALQKIIQEGLALYQGRKLNEALALLDEHSVLFAGYAAFFNLKGLCLSELNEHDLAVKCFVEAVKINPLDPMPYTNIGNSLAKNLQFEEADKYFDLALTVEPNHSEAAVGKGVAAFQRLDYEAAESAFKMALELRPGQLVVEINLGNCYSVQGKYDEALVYLNRSIEREPENGLARTNRGLIHLVRGNFKQGWEDYEYRFDSGNMVPNRFSNIPRWEGPSSPPCNVLIWAEQGLGDEIMFSTIFQDLERLPHTFYIECDLRLYEIFKASFPRLHFVRKRTITSVDGIERQLPLASLGLLFRNQESDFPRTFGGHLARPHAALRPETLEALNTLPRPWIGVSWESYALTKNFRGRKSIIANEFSSLTRSLPGSIINLQFPNPHRHEKPTVQDIPEGVVTLPGINLKNDVEAMAELVGYLDRVITIGNSVAHMCGAFGTPAEVLLPSVPDWRWGSEASKTLWYESLTLIRSQEPDSWKESFNLVLNSPEREGLEVPNVRLGATTAAGSGQSKFKTDQNRWENLDNLHPQWNKRAEIAHKLTSLAMPAGRKTVLDVGCGRQALRTLHAGDHYIGVDTTTRTPDTLVIDLNEEELPPIAHDIAYLLGVLEYLNHPSKLLSKLAMAGRALCLSYAHPLNNNDPLSREVRGWVNALTKHELINLVATEGYHLVVCQTLKRSTEFHEALYLFEKDFG